VRTNLWQELRRRKVFRTAGLYVVGAWLVIQVADIFFPAWGLPETGLRFLFIAAAALFPVALVFGWFFDITSGGIVRTEPAGDAQAVDLRLKRFDYAILVALFIIGGAVLLGSLGKIREEIETAGGISAHVERLANSIAILPFANLDANPDTGFFSDGITEEILHRLSTLGALHVLASTSSFAFRNSDEGPASISRKLGVRYLLQGSVRRDGEQVRVTARLVDEDGFQVWSDTFDRKLERIFVIQADIASKVASQIINEIVPPQALPEGRTTDNMEAYNAYLKGKAYFDARVSNWKPKAEAAFDRAIELDPGFAPPYAGKATLVVNEAPGEAWEDARRLAEKALELDPTLPSALAILGLAQSVLGEREQGLESLQKAIELDPSLGIAYQWISLPLAELGRVDEVREMAERGLEIDPLNTVLLRNSAQRESDTSHFERAEQLLLRLTGLPEPPGWTFSVLFDLYSAWSRYPEAIAAAKDDARRSIRDDEMANFDMLALGYASLGLVDDADYWFGLSRAQARSIEPLIHTTYYLTALGAGERWLTSDLARIEDLLSTDGDYYPAYLLSYGGLAHIEAGNLDKGCDWLERGIIFYESDMAEEPPQKIDYNLLSDSHWWDDVIFEIARAMAFACRETGRDQELQDAMRYLGDYYGWMPDPTSPQRLQEQAEIRLLQGDVDAALDHLLKAADLGWANYFELANRPVWADAIKRPGYQALLRDAMTKIEQQREIVMAADAEHDFRAEVEALLSVKSEVR